MRIKSINIHSFRGIPKELSIDLTKNDRSASLLIFGDNGSGKSSIIDAVEFCLQARLNRKKNLKNEFYPFPISFYSGGSSFVGVTFNTENKTIIRKIIVSQTGNDDDVSFLPNNSHPHELFSISPIVIRRKDILDFNNAPIKQKQVVLFDFLRDNQLEDWENNPSEELTRLCDEKLAIKNKKKKTIIHLAKILDLKDDEIEQVNHHLDDFIREKLYGGFNKKQRLSLEKKGMKIHPNEKALKCISFIRNCNEEIRSINSLIGLLRKNNTIKFDKKRITSEILSNASKFISDSFNKISKIDFIERIFLKLGDETEVSLNIEIELKNGKNGKPNNIFSEAYLDLIALLVFLSFLRESAKLGQSKLLILDDVLQSVDSTIRLSFADFLLKEFYDWQLIITAHDRLWWTQLRNIFRQNNHVFVEKEIIRWDFSTGPVLKSGSLDSDVSIEKAIESGQFEFTCSQTGILLEVICNELSFRLPISIRRRFEDKYTLGDLWPGIFKVLKGTNLKETVQKVETFILLRNLIGAHYNSWAYSISTFEANEFGKSVIDLYRKVYCKSCNKWIEINDNEKSFRCRCKTLVIDQIQ